MFYAIITLTVSCGSSISNINERDDDDHHHHKVYVEHLTQCISESHALFIAAFKRNSKWKGTGEAV